MRVLIIFDSAVEEELSDHTPEQDAHKHEGESSPLETLQMTESKATDTPFGTEVFVYVIAKDEAALPEGIERRESYAEKEEADCEKDGSNGVEEADTLRERLSEEEMNGRKDQK